MNQSSHQIQLLRRPVGLPSLADFTLNGATAGINTGGQGVVGRLHPARCRSATFGAPQGLLGLALVGPVDGGRS